MSRVLLSKIRSITLYKDELTKARRLSPIPQLKCVGSACRLFQPEVVRCYNNGGEGVEVDWTCEADLPEKLRFGRVEVSCEGWDFPGDPYVLKGSCGLEYRLVNTDPSYKEPLFDTIINYVFIALTALVFLFVLSRIISQCCTCLRRRNSSLSLGSNPSGSYRNYNNYYTNPPRPPSDDAPPPPYSPRPGPSSKSYTNTNTNTNTNPNTHTNAGSSSSSASGSGPGGMGFWSGVGLGGLGGLAAGRMFGRGGGGNNGTQYGGYRSGVGQQYDWERARQTRGGGGLFGRGSSSRMHSPTGGRGGSSSGGSGNLGSMRRSTGYGTTNVR